MHAVFGVFCLRGLSQQDKGLSLVPALPQLHIAELVLFFYIISAFLAFISP